MFTLRLIKKQAPNASKYRKKGAKVQKQVFLIILAVAPYLCSVKDFKKYYHIQAPPEEVYKALTFAPTIQLWSGEKAEMTEEPGSEFSLWEGSIVGKNIEFEDSKRIVQQWYFGDQEEPSIVTIKLHPHPDGTSLELRHTNIPDGDFNEITEGWTYTYMASLEDFYLP